MSRWETHRGDEWWYTDHAIEARASSNLTSVPPIFQISARSRTPGVMEGVSLLQALRSAREQFPEFELWCAIDSQTAPLLSGLAAQGFVKWELIEHPHSRDALIVELA